MTLTNPAVSKLPPVTLPVTLKLVPVAAPIFGVVKIAPVLTVIFQLPSNAVVVLSTLALNTEPIKLKPAAVLAEYDPADEN